MAHDDVLDDGPVYSSEIRWYLSQVRQCIPDIGDPHIPARFDAESLLILDVAETEHLRDEWARIAESYRTIAEVAIEAVATLEDQNRKMRGLIKNMGDELMLRKPQ